MGSFTFDASRRVLVSKATFDQLPDGYRAESGPLLDAAPLPDARVVRVETYYIKPRHFRSVSSDFLPLDRRPCDQRACTRVL